MFLPAIGPGMPPWPPGTRPGTPGTRTPRPLRVGVETGTFGSVRALLGSQRGEDEGADGGDWASRNDHRGGGGRHRDGRATGAQDEPLGSERGGAVAVAA